MAPIAAIIISLFWCTVAVLIAGSRGYTPRGIVLCVAGIIAGGVLAGWPGSYVLTDWGVIARANGEFGAHVNAVACGAVFLGALCGLYGAERLRENEFPTATQIFNAALGLIFGGLGGAVVLFMTYSTWGWGLATFGLFPAIVSAAALAGSALGHRFPDWK
ncbi:MAG TPA: hypothetical protein VFC46_05020 [Humisphaera sp.]|nr:hypothetical protein [Humisphaera sp.]